MALSAPRTSRAPWWLRIVVAVGLAFLIWIVVIFWLVHRQAGRDEAQHADAICVFGAAEYYGHPSPIYRARLDHAYALFKSGYAPLIITSGGGAEDRRFTEGGVGRRYLASRGVPDADIIAETQANDTWESAKRVANILRANDLHSCLAVSDGYHLFRVKQMLQRAGVTVYASPRRDVHPPRVSTRMREELRETLSYTAWKMGL